MDVSNPSFTATASHPDLHGALAIGHFVVKTSRVAFESEHQSFDAPFQLLSLRWSGIEGDEIQFSHPTWDGWVINVASHGPLGVPSFREHPLIVMQTKAAIRACRKRSDPKVLVKFLVVFSLIIVLLYFGTGLVHRMLVAALPITVDRALGKETMEAISGELELIDAPSLQVRCQTYVDRLGRPFVSKGYRFSVLIVDSPVPNAYALPGGTILVTTGMTNHLASSEALAGVLAHEIGHVVRRHGVQQQYGSLGLVRLLVSSDAGGAPSGLATGSLLLLNQSHSRDHERDADRFAVELLVKSGINPSGLADFLEELMHLEGEDTGVRIARALSSHPATRERVERIRELSRNSSNGRRFAPME